MVKVLIRATGYQLGRASELRNPAPARAPLAFGGKIKLNKSAKQDNLAAF
jgi:hypothetical protein